MNIIIIPAYNPNEQLVQLVKTLKELSTDPIIIINDGSVESTLTYFKQAKKIGCEIITHDLNKGKGASIKSGIKYANENYFNFTGYITCDGDGQHLPKDILNVSMALEDNPEMIILGRRDFSSKDVPFKSRAGNNFSAKYFYLNTKVKCTDTQTGLRGIPFHLTDDALALPENRYDYEMTFLIAMVKAGTKLKEVNIETVYLDNNSESHFRPVVDSIRIYKKPIKFAITALSSALLDLLIFTILTSVLNETVAIVVLIATITARVISGIYNYLLNRSWSFKSKTPMKKSFFKYLALYVCQLSLSIVLVTFLSKLSIHLTVVKAVVDSILFIGSYFIQKRWVFRKKLNPLLHNN